MGTYPDYKLAPARPQAERTLSTALRGLLLDLQVRRPDGSTLTEIEKRAAIGVAYWISCVEGGASC